MGDPASHLVAYINISLCDVQPCYRRARRAVCLIDGRPFPFDGSGGFPLLIRTFTHGVQRHGARLNRKTQFPFGRTSGVCHDVSGQGPGAAPPRPRGGSSASAAAYMRRVADDLMAAQRQGTVMSFHRVITRHANVEAIANYALGPYKSALSRSAYPSYYKGVAMFMARYFADSSREYAVGKTDIGQVTRDREGRVIVQHAGHAADRQHLQCGVPAFQERRRIPDSRCLGAWFFLELSAARHLPALHREERWQRQRACRGTESVTFKTQSASIEQDRGLWR